jgi:hypothetical protein
MIGSTAPRALPTPNAATVRFAEAMARVMRPATPPAPADAPVSDAVRDAARALGDIVREAVDTAAQLASSGDPAAGTSVASPVADAVGRINDVLDMIEGTPLVSADLRASLSSAVRDAVAAVPNIGITMEKVRGKERVVVDTAVLEAHLRSVAPDATTAGTDDAPDAPVPAAAPAADAAPTTLVDRRLAAALRALRAMNDRGDLQLLQPLPLRAAVPVRDRIDLLV